VAVRAPAEAATPRFEDEPDGPRRFDPTDGLEVASDASARSTSSTVSAPPRFEREVAVPGPRRPDPREAAAEPAPEEEAPRRREVTESGPRLRDDLEVAVRETSEPELPRAEPGPSEPRSFDPTEGLAALTPASAPLRREEARAPRRFDADRAVDGPARPERLELAAAAPPPEPTPDEPRRLEHTAYQNRFGDEKLRALEEFGGGVETERAVAAGLAYLASIQNRRGFWGERSDFDRDKYGDVRIGKTGLALLAFLGAGHTPGASTEHADVARRAVEWLLGEQHENGHVGNASAYCHGIATYALAECYAMTHAENLREPLERAVAQILANQHDEGDERFLGGWGYYFADGHVWDGDRWPRVSVTAWQVMALESARLGGLEVPDGAFTAAGSFLANAWDPRREAFRYCHDPNRLRSGYPILPASTPAAMFALSLLGVDLTSPELADARAFVLERAPDRYRYTSDDAFVSRARGNLYFWYYATLAMFRTGGSSWSRWNAAMKDTLLDAQAEDGSWRPISIYADYAGDDDDERAYTTAINVLTLEVYYRYFTPLLEVR